MVDEPTIEELTVEAKGVLMGRYLEPQVSEAVFPSLKSFEVEMLKAWLPLMVKLETGAGKGDCSLES